MTSSVEDPGSSRSASLPIDLNPVTPDDGFRDILRDEVLVRDTVDAREMAPQRVTNKRLDLWRGHAGNRARLLLPSLKQRM
jgi:hypothetical protein